MHAASDSLLSILDLEPLEGNRFRGRSPRIGWRRVFGGQVIGQALLAACRTVEDRLPHSPHAYFLLPGDPERPIDYAVETLRDGRSFDKARAGAPGRESDLRHVRLLPDRRARLRPPDADARRADA